MTNEVLIAIVVAILAAIALLLLIVARRGRKLPQGGEGDWVTDEAAAAVEDVIDQFIGTDAHHDVAVEAVHGPADELTRIKGLGPKAAARLNEIGVTRFDQMARWSDNEVAAIDGQMGAFKGRIYRDQWIEQAKLLAAGDTEAFEAKFGKLGA